MYRNMWSFNQTRKWIWTIFLSLGWAMHWALAILELLFRLLTQCTRQFKDDTFEENHFPPREQRSSTTNLAPPSITKTSIMTKITWSFNDLPAQLSGRVASSWHVRRDRQETEQGCQTKHPALNSAILQSFRGRFNRRWSEQKANIIDQGQVQKWK